MPVCAAGHDSATTDFCDVCGTPLDDVSTPVASRQPASVPTEPCAQCGAPRTGRFCEQCGRDHNSPPPVLSAAPPVSGPQAPVLSAAPPVAGSPAPVLSTVPPVGSAALPVPGPPVSGPPSGWVAVVAADQDHYRQVMAANGPDAASMAFPDYCPERRFVLTGAEVRIGRRSVSRGFHPEIDLSGPPEDPGVSHMHALFRARPDGGWSIVDTDSTNGTTINRAADPIAPRVAVSLSDGDRVHVGAWTTITLHAPSASVT